MTETIENLTKKVVFLEEENAYLKAQLYGRKKETVVFDNTDIFPEMADYLKDKKGVEKKEDSKEEKAAPPAKKKRKPFSHFSFPENAEREINVVDLTEDEKFDPITGQDLNFIGIDKSEKLVYIHGRYKVVETHLYKYSVPNKPKAGVVSAHVASHPITGCRADVSLLSHILISKYADHLPLYRIEEQFRRDGLVIARQTLSKWVLQLGTTLQPLGDLLRDQILNSSRVFTDDSPVKLQTKGKGKLQEGRIWVYVGGDGPDPPLVWFEFTKDRSHSHTLERMKDFQGVFHADAFGAYEKMNSRDGVDWQACWAHARRKFFDVPNPNEFCQKVLLLMDDLFELEQKAWNLETSQKRQQFRDDKTKPFIEALIKTIQDHYYKACEPKGKLKTAMEYVLTRTAAFKTFLKYPDARIDNNVSERAIRPMTIGRKNWLFFGSEKGGQAAANIISLVQTCRKLELNPKEYLEDILGRITDHPKDELSQLLPQNWKK
jgi:transposase